MAAALIAFDFPARKLLPLPVLPRPLIVLRLSAKLKGFFKDGDNMQCIKRSEEPD
jgi:hypothetical protein